MALVLTLQAGLLLSLGLALFIDPAEARQCLLRTLVIGAISHPAILGSRVAYRFLEEIVIWLKASTGQDAEKGRILLYGAGGRCQLFLKERAFNNSSSYDGRVIVGLLDDEPSLHFQWVQGYQVLGGLKDLPRIISRYHITGVIITAMLTPETTAALKELARQHGFRVSEWRFQERELEILPSPAGQTGAAAA